MQKRQRWRIFFLLVVVVGGGAAFLMKMQSGASPDVEEKTEEKRHFSRRIPSVIQAGDVAAPAETPSSPLQPTERSVDDLRRSATGRIAPRIDWNKRAGTLDAQVNSAFEAGDGEMAMELVHKLGECDMAERMQKQIQPASGERETSTAAQAERGKEQQRNQEYWRNASHSLVESPKQSLAC